MTVADMIKKKREELSMTQEELAERMEVSRQAVSKWETGLSLPTEENLSRLAELLEIEAWPDMEPAPPTEETEELKALKRKLDRWRTAALCGWALVLAAAIFLAAMYVRARTPLIDDPRPTVTPTPQPTSAVTMTIPPQSTITPPPIEQK